MIRRKKLTIFTDCKDTTTVLELKKMIEGIIKQDPENMRLTREGQIMEDTASLQSYGLSSSTAKAQSPAAITLALRVEPSAGFETPDVTPYSSPPDLPDVMKAQDGNAQEAAA